MQPNMNQANEDKPVAYTPDGQPLYAHPQQVPQEQTSTQPAPVVPQPQVVYLSRSINPHQQEISPEIKQKHDESRRRYPDLNLSEGEYVITALRRHPIGLISVWVVLLLLIILVTSLPVLAFMSETLPFQITSSGMLMLGIVLLAFIGLMLISGLIYTVVYQANRFYLTNESVTQHIQGSLFSKKNQTISLGNVEDASYRRHGILQTIFNYGTIRLSTEGEETTYRFNFAADPEHQVYLLNNAVEAFKNFRPVDQQDGETL